MEFSFTEEQAMIAETAQQFFVENADSKRTRAAMASDGFDHETWQSFCQELGFSGILISEEFGGSALNMVEFACVAESAGAQVAAIPLLSLAMPARAIAAGGSDSQRSEWLPKLAAGEIIAASGSSDKAAFEDGKLTGIFEFVPHANIADIFVLNGSDGAWIISKNDVHIGTFTTMDQTRPLSRLMLKNAPADPLKDSQAAKAASHEGGLICLAAEALGGAQACLDRTIAYANERVQFGRTIGSFQAYKHRLADMMIEIEQARSAVYWAACSIDEGSEDAEFAIHAAKCFCADTFFKCAGDMIQLHGGIGFTWEHDAHLFFKRARAIQSMLNGGDWHREKIATMILGEAT